MVAWHYRRVSQTPHQHDLPGSTQQFNAAPPAAAVPPVVTDPGGDPFSPVGVTWSRVSPKLAIVRLVATGIFFGVVAVPLIVVAVVIGRWTWAVVVAWVVIAVVVLALVPRRVRSWGYAERDDDLLIKHGLLARNLVVVPYGRMQYVDVHAGPVDRALGLASVQLHTASAGTDAAIPGLPALEASRMRDRLAARGEAKLAGL